MDEILQGFLTRNLPEIASDIHITLDARQPDGYTVYTEETQLFVQAGTRVAACNGIYTYLQEICHVQYSWCGNESLSVSAIVPFSGKLEKTIEQKYRVYMNYCTLDYSMCWWDWPRWEQEIDFMAMNGINMPLTVIGTEAVLFETLLQFGFTQEEALQSISGPAFWAWQLMTNIDGYLPPPDKSYVYARLALGKKILERVTAFGMIPIQQGFCGHVPMLLKEKYPKANIIPKAAWCLYPKTAQLDPLDPLFETFGQAYLQTLEKLLGNHHYLACDPFHEGTPPKPWKHYLKRVGRAIDALYKNFDEQSVWVMQAWTMRKHIVRVVPKDRLLILDLNSERTPKNQNVWGYPVVAGMLHNFGGKNAMQGKLKLHCRNPYAVLKKRGANVVGSGMFMEGIEQNPVVYDLQFSLLTKSDAVDFDSWLRDYILRRYGAYDETLYQAWQLLVETCYREDGYGENAVGSTLCARPMLSPKRTGPCDYTELYYAPEKLEKAWTLFLSVSEKFAQADGYQFDVCDLTRQVLSNRFHSNQATFAQAYKQKDYAAAKAIADTQMELLKDLDAFLGLRKNFCLSRWINQSHALAENETERRYYDKNARTLITLWGNIDGDCSLLYDYAWREWSGLIQDFYAIRWQKFYDAALEALKKDAPFTDAAGKLICERPYMDATAFGKQLLAFEKAFCESYCTYDAPQNQNVIPNALALGKKWEFQA